MDITESMMPLPPSGLKTGGLVSPGTAGAVTVIGMPATSVAQNSQGETAPAKLAVSEVIRRQDTRLALDVDEASGRVVGRFIDKETGHVVRQVPPEQMVRLLARARQMIGALLDKTV